MWFMAIIQYLQRWEKNFCEICKMLKLSSTTILMVSLTFLFSFVDLKITLLSKWLWCTTVFQQLLQELCGDDTVSSFAFPRVVNFHTEVCRSSQLIRKINEKLHLYLSLASSLRVEVSCQVFVVGCMLTAVDHAFLCTSSINTGYFEQRT